VKHGRTGFLVAPRNAAELAEAITRPLIDGPLRHRWEPTESDELKRSVLQAGSLRTNEKSISGPGRGKLALEAMSAAEPLLASPLVQGDWVSAVR
jgi:hypothetical protein